MSGDENYTNKFPKDAAEIANLVRQADPLTATRLLQVWGSKQRDIGALKAIQTFKGQIDDVSIRAR
jgi:hypothetical protein